ncbi:MAG TPA: AMP-binding protein [Burkholderiaceae bacterium]|nr:AMP-binding protein [Burkholderiaceae bacterium]
MSANPFRSDWLAGGDDDRLRPQGTLSYVSGLTDEVLRFLTIPQQLDKTVGRHGSRDAAIFAAEGVRLSWYDLKARADELAAGLLALGLRRGNRVGIWAPNRHEWVITQFATARIGLILVNINPAYRKSELEYALNKVGCRALVMARRFKSSDYLGMLGEIAPEIHFKGASEVLDSVRLPSLKHVVLLGEPGPQAPSPPSLQGIGLPGGARSTQEPVPPRCLSYAQVCRLGGPAQRGRLESLSAALDPDDAINIQFTSGTTGSPKGATLSHFNIVNNARFCAKAMALSPDDKLCIPVPLYHCFGMVLGVLCCVASGATMVFPGEGFDAADTLRNIARHRCTALHGVPTMFTAMLEDPSFAQHDLSSLRTGIMAGAPCPIETMRKVIARMHMREVTIAYGMTETSPISFQSGLDDPLERRVSTVGRIQPHLEVKVVDAAGRIVPVGVSGELCTRGYAVMRGYWQDAERTTESIDATGWMHSGDLATIDAQGYCNIVGRVKDMLIRGGENVFPREIEEYLLRHPAIQDVQVFGVPDPKYGEEVCAWIVPRRGQSIDEQQVREFCRGQIAHYKVPRYVRIVEQFPLTATGKAQKFEMRKVMVAELGVQEARTA